jgi:hypothetical protein
MRLTSLHRPPQASDALPVGLRLGRQDWSSSNSAFTLSRGSCEAVAYSVFRRPSLYQHAIVPSPFRVWVSWLTHEQFSEFIPAGPGMPSQLSQRTPHSKPSGEW